MNKLKHLILTTCFLTMPFFINEIFAQAPPPPHPGGPNSAPVSGLAILASLGVGYGIIRLRKIKKK